MRIVDIKAREILDSRGFPTLEIDVLTQNHMGRCSIPSGASTGRFEAVEWRDRDQKRYLGRGVKGAVEHVETILKPALIGKKVDCQSEIDKIMCQIDGTHNKSRLGANSILGISLAAARCAASAMSLPLFRYLGGVYLPSFPKPFMNILNGGVHADNTLCIQEFMIVPHGLFPEALRMGSEIFHTLKKCLKEQGYSTNVGDEGGFAPDMQSTKEALDVIMQAIDRAGYIPGQDVSLALDVAASELYEDEKYTYEKELCSSEDMVSVYEDLVANYPIISIEDGLEEEDWSGWEILTQKLGDKVRLVGDDLFVTHTKRLLRGIEQKVANTILIKPNQIGTLTETLEAIHLARTHHYDFIISHRSGETEDCFIADLAVATQAMSIKTGSLSRTDRVAKYNQLLRIFEGL